METSLRDLFATGLPINRKERYYTGTVLPALLCANSMRHLHRLTDHLGLGRLHVRTEPGDCTVEFFTEYSPVESAVGKAKADFAGLEGTTKDTPDVVILVTKPEPALIALEAKMFDRPSLKSMQQQLDAQRVQLEILAIDLAKRLNSPGVEMVHRALLPQSLAKAFEDMGGLRVPVVEWEWVRDNYADVDQDYFHAVLDHALTHYDQLKSKYSGNHQGEVRGDRLVNASSPATQHGRSWESWVVWTGYNSRRRSKMARGRLATSRRATTRLRALAGSPSRSSFADSPRNASTSPISNRLYLTSIWMRHRVCSSRCASAGGAPGDDDAR